LQEIRCALLRHSLVESVGALAAVGTRVASRAGHVRAGLSLLHKAFGFAMSLRAG